MPDKKTIEEYRKRNPQFLEMVKFDNLPKNENIRNGLII
jgi:hypothetical protein